MAAVFGGGLFVVANAIYFSLFLLPASDWAARGFIGLALDVLGVLAALLFFAGLAGLCALVGRSVLGLFGLLLAGASVVAAASYVVFALAYVAYKALLSPDPTGPPPASGRATAASAPHNVPRR